MNKTLRNYLIQAGILGILLIIGALLVHYFENPRGIFDNETQQWWRDLQLNLGSGLITSVLIIFFYDLVLLKYEKIEKTNKAQIALNMLYKILDEHFRHVLYGIYQSSAVNQKQFQSLDKLFSDEYFSEVQQLDFNKSPYLDKDDEKQNQTEEYSSTPRQYQIILDYNKRLNELILTEILNGYSQFLESDICEALQEIRYSPFILFSYHIPSITMWNNQFKMLKLFAVKGTIAANGWSIEENEEFVKALKVHITIFKKIVLLHNFNILQKAS